MEKLTLTQNAELAGYWYNLQEAIRVADSIERSGYGAVNIVVYRERKKVALKLGVVFVVSYEMPVT
jgi:hypothetical protein